MIVYLIVYFSSTESFAQLALFQGLFRPFREISLKTGDKESTIKLQSLQTIQAIIMSQVPLFERFHF